MATKVWLPEQVPINDQVQAGDFHIQPDGSVLVCLRRVNGGPPVWEPIKSEGGGGGGAGITDGDKGDITVSGIGTVWTIDNDVVTNTKLADQAQSTIKGRAVGSGTGDPTDLTPGQLRAVFGMAFLRKTADQSNTSGTVNQDVTDLGFSIAANTTYAIRYVLSFSADAATTGLILGCNGPAAPTSVLLSYQMHITGDTDFTNRISTSLGAGGFFFASGSLGTTKLTAFIDIMIRNGANAGTLIPRFRTSVDTAPVTIHVDSYGLLWEVS